MTKIQTKATHLGHLLLVYDPITENILGVSQSSLARALEIDDKAVRHKMGVLGIVGTPYTFPTMFQRVTRATLIPAKGVMTLLASWKNNSMYDDTELLASELLETLSTLGWDL